MLSTQPVKYLLVFAITFASCRASRNIATTTNDEVHPTIAVAISSGNHFDESSNTTAAQPDSKVQDSTINAVTNEVTADADAVSNTNKAKKKITSFAQMKEMASTGEIAMSKKDLKTLNRLEKHYKGNYEKFRADTFEFTDKAKIIGGIGLLGLLLGIITGSAFGWFLFIVAALAFLLRYLNIIAF